MNWIEFFFGWLFKSEYEITMLDGIMFWLEWIIFWVIVLTIYYKIKDIKERKDK